MRRPLSIFALFVAAYLAVIGFGWLQETGSSGELPGHAAKIEAILRLLRTGDFAWFPDYLSGSPSATLLSFALAVPVYAPGLWLASAPEIGMKATAMVLLALGGFSAFAFGRRISGHGWSGFAVGCAYLLSPQLLLRAGWLEHMTILVEVPLVPLAFLALLRVAERGTSFDAILLAATWSASMLAWSKMGATMVIPLAIFAGAIFLRRPECRRNLVRGAVWAIPAALLLAFVPLLPLLRERGSMSVFELDPFNQWQAAYSVKTATSWFDRAGALFTSLPPLLRVDRGGYYLGAVGLAAVTWTIIRTWHDIRHSREVAAIRIFLTIALAMFWFSFGPRSVIQGHFELLDGAGEFPDLGIPLHWLALSAQGFLIYWLIPAHRGRCWTFAGLFAVYLFIPAFRLLEHLPLYADLRAPDSFWILNGTFAWATASALAVVFTLRQIDRLRWQQIGGGTALVLACLDFSPYFGWFYRGGLGEPTLEAFRHAVQQLDGTSGRVLPQSDRYFYLEVPGLTGHPLATEALNHYLLPRDTARLQAAAKVSATDMLSYLQLAGVGSVLLDLQDPSLSKVIQKWYRSILPVKYEDASFAILFNPSSLYPAFFSATAAPAVDGLGEYVDALEQAKKQVVTIANPAGGPPPFPTSGHVPSVSPAPDFLVLTPATSRTPSRISLNAPGKTGWVVLDESWHPDWKAAIDGATVPVYRGAGGFPAVAVTDHARVVEFRFQPPAWYSVSLLVGLVAWIGALAFLAGARFLPARLRKTLVDPAIRGESPREAVLDRFPISRPLALVPTYNEADTIIELLDRVLASSAGLEILVIDDSSPDGTAAKVRAHRTYGHRLHLLERPSKQGLGSAYREGFRWAIDRHYDACVEIDADLSHDPADIPRLIAALDAGADAAIGSRYLNGLRVVNWPRHRLLLSTGATRYVRGLTGLPLTDATSGFKALRAAALGRIDWSELRADGYGFQVELHWLLWQAGFRLVEVPIIFTERRAGQTKMTAGIACEAAWRVLNLAWSGIMERPKS